MYDIDWEYLKCKILKNLNPKIFLKKYIFINTYEVRNPYILNVKFQLNILKILINFQRNAGIWKFIPNQFFGKKNSLGLIHQMLSS